MLFWKSTIAAHRQSQNEPRRLANTSGGRRTLPASTWSRRLLMPPWSASGQPSRSLGRLSSPRLPRPPCRVVRRKDLGARRRREWQHALPAAHGGRRAIVEAATGRRQFERVSGRDHIRIVARDPSKGAVCTAYRLEPVSPVLCCADLAEKIQLPKAARSGPRVPPANPTFKA